MKATRLRPVFLHRVYFRSCGLVCLFLLFSWLHEGVLLSLLWLFRHGSFRWFNVFVELLTSSPGIRVEIWKVPRKWLTAMGKVKHWPILRSVTFFTSTISRYAELFPSRSLIMRFVGALANIPFREISWCSKKLFSNVAPLTVIPFSRTDVSAHNIPSSKDARVTCRREYSSLNNSGLHLQIKRTFAKQSTETSIRYS